MIPEMSSGKNDLKRNEKAMEAVVGSERKLDKRKCGNLRRNGTNLERKDRIESYWNSMSNEMKKSLLRIRTNVLKRYFGPSKDLLESEILEEALAFFEQNRSWKFLAVL